MLAAQHVVRATCASSHGLRAAHDVLRAGVWNDGGESEDGLF